MGGCVHSSSCRRLTREDTPPAYTRTTAAASMEFVDATIERLMLMCRVVAWSRVFVVVPPQLAGTWPAELVVYHEGFLTEFAKHVHVLTRVHVFGYTVDVVGGPCGLLRACRFRECAVVVWTPTHKIRGTALTVAFLENSV